MVTSIRDMGGTSCHGPVLVSLLFLCRRNNTKLTALPGVNPLPVGVAGHRVPPLVLVDVDALDVHLCVEVIRAAGQALGEAPPVAPGVDPGGVVVADAPHDADAVALHHAQVASDLPPEPAHGDTRFIKG
ncbi:hypothetical protein EYF80_040066 [Liparis tanakae]|uniref:Uncharacterized protein n=1 Tax=Liparis tanakae TaxID=230148 RepID=A0A4Z2G813_9TELE|nr:hypothetical protein EYF80_040066 [Liparis tanakae]